MSELFNYCHVVGCTDVGRKRAANEDRMSNAITQNGLVAIVCDGMGGHVGGATASRIAVESIIDHLNKVYYDDPRIAIGESIDVANKAILQGADEHPELAGMGSTCVMLLVRDGKVYIGHVGDSRIYLIRSKRIVQLTKDHSYVQILVDSGEITKEEAEKHPRKNEITNALGIPNMSPATVADDAFIPEAGDCFILCSDGLSGMVPDVEICKIVSKQTEMNAQERVNKLVSTANANGGVDNITVQLVEFSVSPSSVTVNKKKRTWVKITLPILLVLFISAGAYYCFYYLKNLDKVEETVEQQSNPSQKDKVAIKIDTIEKKLSDVKYKAKERIIVLKFGDNSLIIENNDKKILEETDTKFIPSSLTTNFTDKELLCEFNNSLLSFTDTKPSIDNLVVSLLTSDSTKVYRYTIGIIMPDEPLIQSIVNTNTKPVNVDVDSQPVEVEKTDTVEVVLKYDTITNNDSLIVIAGSSDITIRIKETEKKVYRKVVELDDKYTVYNELCWGAVLKDMSGKIQIIFKYNSTQQIYKEYKFQTGFKTNDGTIILGIKLEPKSNMEIIPEKEVRQDEEKQPVSEEESGTIEGAEFGDRS